MKISKYEGGKYQADAGRINGVRSRKVFATKAEAERWIADRRKDKTRLSLKMPVIDPASIEDASEALGILEGKVSLAGAARFWKENNLPENAQTLGESLPKFLEHLKLRDSRPRYLDGMRTTLESFKESIGDRALFSYNPDSILSWLKNPDWSKATFRNRRRELSVFFNWCVRQGALRLNPVARIPSPKLNEYKIDVLTVDQTRKLLSGLQGSDRAYFAIAIFAGLRPAEIDRLTWGDIKLNRGHIDLRSESSKARARRLVMIQPCLKAWLDPIIKQVKWTDGSGREVTSGIAHDISSAIWNEWIGKQAIPISRCDKNEMMKRASYAAGLDRWPKNICRHSFGSYHLERWRNANETALQMGHSTTAMLFRHYREVVTSEAAKAFWEIMP